MNTQKLINILASKGFAVREAEGGSELVIACPLCFSESQKLYINAATGQWICFQCEEKGHLHNLLIRICEKTVNEAFELERELLGGTKLRKRPLVPRPAPPSEVQLPKEFIPLGGPGIDIAKEYMESRGVSLALAQEMGVGHCLTGLYAWRVIIPVVTQGALRTFVARSWIQDEKKKVLTPKGSQAERALFGYDELVDPRREEGTALIILVEGVFDAMAMWQHGYRETIATLGAHITELQRALLKRLTPVCVYLLRDGDAAGREGAIKDARELACDLLPVSIALLPDGTDPASASREDIRMALQEARPVDTEYGVETMREVHHR